MMAQMRINEMILYVQEHLEQRMTLEELASVAGYSQLPFPKPSNNCSKPLPTRCAPQITDLRLYSLF